MTHAQRTELIDDLELMTDVNRDQAAQVLKRLEKLCTDPEGGLVDSETVKEIKSKAFDEGENRVRENLYNEYLVAEVRGFDKGYEQGLRDGRD